MSPFSGRKFALIFVLFWLGIMNHCAVEAALALDQNDNGSQECPVPLHGDRGASGDSHTHGTPCDSFVVTVANGIEAVKALTDSLEVPLLFVFASLFLNQFEAASSQVVATYIDEALPPKIDAIFSLHSSPNAPPHLPL